ncbi:MAG: branched-chain amino acid aminotransferase [Thermodesulfobacteriota bacterium]
MQIAVNQISPALARRKPDDESKLGFGVLVANHMFKLDYNLEQGWHSPRLEPYGPLHLYPAAAVLHYAQEAFEGLKAYRSAGGEIFLFRPRANLARMSRTCQRLCIPAFPEELVLEGMKQLIALDRDWVPSAPGTSLYIRPTIIATEPFLGVREAHEYLLFIITGPVGAYYPEGFAPVKIMVEDTYTRAAPGGVGEAKTSGNYAASLKAQIEAHKKGFTQVLWLDGKERRYVEEVGTMNIFFKFKDELATAPLGGTILPGITRDSIITLAKDMGLKVAERLISIDEVIDKARSGELEEVFGSGTAAVVSPVSTLQYQGKDYQISGGRTGPLAQKLFDTIVAIQYGTAEDTHGWREKVI